MDEAEWRTASEPMPMLAVLRDRASARKLRLFAVACCRRLWPELTDRRSAAAVVIAERYADGRATDAELARARDEAQTAYANALLIDDAAAFAAVSATLEAAREAAETTAVFAAVAIGHGGSGARVDEQREQARLLREVFGNPFLPVAIQRAWQAWNGETVVRLARSIYDNGRFDDLPLLADALADAGCDQAALLDHCRSDGPHVRGCWALDLILACE